MFLKYCFLICSLVLLMSVVRSDEIVNTTHGKVQGKVMKTLLKEVTYYAFMGIPYATPPVKELRFLPPRPAAPWTGILPAMREKQPCVQYNSNVKRSRRFGTYGQEDCLYVDIFTPRPGPPLRPILVFLHSEYFRYSHNKTEDYAPDFFIEEDVVMATISHRLSVFGFLSLDDESLQGNAGLRDIVAGLQWIKDNAERFGGDPDKITVMGSQGGAAAADLLIHSDARRLFNSIILQGGSARSSMYLQDGGRERAMRLATELGIGSGSSEYLLKSLNDVPAHKIFEKELRAMPENYNKDHQRPLVAFGPIVEKRNGLLTYYPERSTSIDVPVMIGFNSREGLEKSLEYLVDPKYLSFVNKDFVLLFPEREDFRFDPDSSYYDEAVDDVKSFYFQNGKVTIRNAPEFVTYMGDVFTKPIDKTAKFYANISSSPVYYYYFDYYSNLNENKDDILRLAAVHDGTWGAASGDELCYLFKCPRLKDKYLKHNTTNSEEITLLRKMVRMWSNFAKYGNPTPNNDNVLQGLKWPAYTSEHKEYLHINRKLTAKRNLNSQKFQFWDNFVNKWRQKALNGIVAKARKLDEL